MLPMILSLAPSWRSWINCRFLPPDDRRPLVLQRVPTRCRIAPTLVGDYGIAMLFIVLVLVG